MARKPAQPPEPTPDTPDDTPDAPATDLCLRKTRRVAEELTNSCRLLGVVVVVV